MKISSEQINLQATASPDKKINGGMKESVETKKLRLRKATKEFESFFILNMLKAMRKTIPKSEMTDGGLGQDMYTSMFDEELARKVAGSSPNSIAQMLYKSLEKHLEATEMPGAGETRDNKEISTSIRDQKRIRAVEPRPPVAPAAEPIKTEKPPEKPAEPENVSGPIVAVNNSRPKVSADPVLKKFGSVIEKASKQYDVDSRLIYSVILAESGGRPDAVSSKGAKGLMQLIDSTAAEMGVADSLNPHENIVGGTKYLRQLLDKYDGSVRLALAAYNAGPGNVSKYNGVPPFDETRKYIENVLGRLHNAKKP